MQVPSFGTPSVFQRLRSRLPFPRWLTRTRWMSRGLPWNGADSRRATRTNRLPGDGCTTCWRLCPRPCECSRLRACHPSSGRTADLTGGSGSTFRTTRRSMPPIRERLSTSGSGASPDTSENFGPSLSISSRSPATSCSRRGPSGRQRQSRKLEAGRE